MRKHILTIGITTAIAAGMVGAPALADENMLSDMDEDTSITMSGTVIEAREDAFDLQVGAETVTVDVEDEIRDGGAYTLLAGDRVTVSGQVEEHFFQDDELEANALHVNKIGTTFIIDEDYADRYGMVSGRVMDDFVDVAGTVTSVNDDDDEFGIHGPAGDFIVEVDELAENPLDDDGYLQLGVGDSVRVAGEIDDDWLEGREIVATSIDVVRVGVIVD